MNSNTIKNIPHSVFQRLLNQAKTNTQDFNLFLSRYGMERFLYRLSVSAYHNQFILKGASLFLVWRGRNHRVTRDADLLGLMSPNTRKIARIFKDVCGIQCTVDGMIYPPKTLKMEEIREAQKYKGVRITLQAILHTARIPLQIDIGFGDVVTPGPDEIEYPTLFEAPPPKLKAYPPCTLAAEKLEAMVHLGWANTRMKDFYDIWLMSTLLSFEGNILRRAIANTFKQRETALPTQPPYALSPSFYEDQHKQTQWKAFVKKSKPDMVMDRLSIVIGEISRFLQPVLDSLQSESGFHKYWLPKKGWTSKE